MIDNLEIKIATINDLPQIQQLAKQVMSDCYRSYLGDKMVDWFIESGGIDEELAANLENCSILCNKQEGIGFSLIQQHTIQLIMVATHFQRKGYGSLLLNHCESILSKQKYHTIQVETFRNNTQATSFFKKNGWEIIYESEKDIFGFVRVLLEKQIHQLTPPS